MANTLSGVVDTLVALLAGVTGVTKVYGYEPGAESVVDRAVTVVATGVDPDFYELAVRIYVRINAADQAHAVLYDLIEAVDVRLHSTATQGPSRWTIDYDAATGALAALARIEIGREDYY